MESKGMRVWNATVQVCVPGLTALGFLLISMKQPGYGVIVSLFSQIFWLYSSYKAWKTAGQVGIFVNTVISTLIFAYGVINYWFL